MTRAPGCSPGTQKHRRFDSCPVLHIIKEERIKKFLFELLDAFVSTLFILAILVVPIGFFIGVMMFGGHFGIIPVFVVLFIFMVVVTYFNIRDCNKYLKKK